MGARRRYGFPQGIRVGASHVVLDGIEVTGAVGGGIAVNSRRRP